jgi:hypothetical protein
MNSSITLRGKKYGLLLNGHYTTKAQAEKLKQTMKSLKVGVSVRKYKENKYVIYGQGYKGRKFVDKMTKERF